MSANGTLVLHYENASELEMAMEFTNVEAVKQIVLWNENLTEMWRQFQMHFTPVTAAGGLVLNEKDEILLIFRRGKWDLPKGKVDPGETIRAAALREVAEECGLTAVTIEATLEQTYHTYSMQGSHFLKTTHWFLMRSSDSQQPVPQAEEDIEKAIWADRPTVQECMKNTYPNILLLLQHFLKT